MPGSEHAPQPRIRRIGREPDNDVVINLPTVSGYHARIVWDERTGETVLEDLGSTNGTFIDSHERRIMRASIVAGDTIYLGSHAVSGAELIGSSADAPPPPLVFSGDQLVIGRDPACDRVLDFAMVSGRHARIYREGDRTLIEDLQSLNGTHVNGSQIAGPTVIRPGDLVGFGSYTVVFREAPRVISTVTISQAPPAAQPSSDAPAPATLEMPDESAFARELARVVARPGQIALLLLQAPVAAALIALAFKAADRAGLAPNAAHSSASGIPAALSFLTIAAVWFGLANVVLGNILFATRTSVGHSDEGPASVLSRFMILGAVSLVQCAIAWSIAAGTIGLRGSALFSIALLALASLAALALALLVTRVAQHPVIAIEFLVATVLVAWLLGGERWPLPRMNHAARLAANLLPSRWAFEGLLVLDAESRAPLTDGSVDRTSRSGADRTAETLAPDLDPVQAYFPLESERMGPRADTLALVAIVFGVLGSAAFAARSRELRRCVRARGPITAGRRAPSRG